MKSLQTVRCASGSCFKDGTLQCAKCKVTFYCSKACQKDHWTKHKNHCSTHTPLAEGAFEFLKLSRNTRDKVYEDLLVARRTPDQQADYDELINATGDRFSIRNLLDQVEERLMISPGTPLWGVKGYQPLVYARGLLNANKQINEELTSTLFTKNTFITPVGETFRYAVAPQLFAYKLNPTSLAQIKHLVISVSTQFDIRHPNHSDGVAALKHNLNHIVKSLNQLGNTLESLKIRFISCFAGRVEEMRGDIDPLLTQPTARPVQVMRMNNTVFTFTHKNIRKFYTSGFDLGEAFEGLNIPVKNFQIYGDLPGEVIERLNRKFAVGVPSDNNNPNNQDPTPTTAIPTSSPTTSSATASSNSSASAFTESASSCVPTGQSRDKLAEKNPEDEKMIELAERLARTPISKP